MNCTRRLPRHLVLDLDETLVHTEDDIHRYVALGIANDPKLLHIRQNTFVMRLVDVVGARGAGQTEVWWVSKRPRLDLFLYYAFRTFETVSVWTAAKKKYAEAIVEEVFRDHPQPYLVWHWEMCEYDEDGHIIKPLEKMALYMGVELEELCILDDNRKTFSKNPDNAIWMPRWDPEPTVEGLERADNAFMKLIKMWSAIETTELTKQTRLASVSRRAPSATAFRLAEA